jgi:hypothetical protein
MRRSWMTIATIAAAISFGSSAAARRFGVSIATAGRWVTRYKTTGRFRLRLQGAIAGPAVSRRSSLFARLDPPRAGHHAA